MPLDGRAAFQLGLLLLALPVQLLISHYYSAGDHNQRSFILHRMINDAVGFKDKLLSWPRWEEWCGGLLREVRRLSGVTDEADEEEEEEEESPAVINQHINEHGYFAGSLTPRSPRPPHVKYRVGQVIRHKIWGYRGIIVGWDETAKAPPSWLKQMHPKDKPHWKDLPNYSVLVDSRDRTDPQRTYVAEENIEIISNTKVIHPEVDEIFEDYDGAQYLPRPWLKKIYPHD